MGRTLISQPGATIAPDINQTVAQNFKRLLGERSPETWWKQTNPVYVSGPKKGNRVSKRKLRDVLNCINSPSLDVIAAIAEAEALEPYLMLFPGLIPSDAPVLVTRSQREVITAVLAGARVQK